MTTAPAAPRLTLVLSTPRVPAGLLTRDAWLALEAAALVLGRDDDPQVEAVRAAGVEVVAFAEPFPPAAARALVEHALAQGEVVWVGSVDGDPGLSDAIAAEVSRLPVPPAVEVVVGSWDAPGARVLDLVAVMDRLRSPGGCPWDAEQTHRSLVPYLVEEAHEAAEAIETGVVADMVDELGDVLLQVAFHARVGQEHPSEPFDLDDVASAIVAKLVRRHPHVFADVDAADAAAVEANWETIKAAERVAKGEAGATGGGVAGGGAAEAVRGIPVAMPPLARATKVVSRLRRRGHGDALAALLADGPDDEAAGRRLLALVAEIEGSGEDPDQALRAVLRRLGSDHPVAGQVPGTDTSS